MLKTETAYEFEVEKLLRAGEVILAVSPIGASNFDICILNEVSVTRMYEILNNAEGCTFLRIVDDKNKKRQPAL